MPYRGEQSVGGMAMAEFDGQRMHRDTSVETTTAGFAEVAPPRPHAHSWATQHVRAFEPPPAGYRRQTPQFTVGRKNTLGTATVTHKLSLEELRVGQVSLADNDARELTSNYRRSFAAPDQGDPLRGRGAPRGGMAGRMPFSEVERRFGQLDSTGTMPGKFGEAEKPTSLNQLEYTTHSADARAKARQGCEFTLKWHNAIGSSEHTTKVPAELLNATHFDLTSADPGPRFQTTTAATHRDLGVRPTAAARAGARVPIGVSEVSRDFKHPLNTRQYDIISNAPRSVTEEDRADVDRKHPAGGNANPRGRKQLPSIDPRLRGPSGTRQSFDLITGVERESWRW